MRGDHLDIRCPERWPTAGLQPAGNPHQVRDQPITNSTQKVVSRAERVKERLRRSAISGIAELDNRGLALWT